MSDAKISTDTSEIRSWRSIVTLIVFVVTNIIVLFPFKLPILIPRPLWSVGLKALVNLRIISPENTPDWSQDQNTPSQSQVRKGCSRFFKRLDFPLNFVTAPLVADLFLLAILAIGKKEVHDGIIGANGIAPYDIMLFFLSLAYIAISVDASGLIRLLALVVLKKGGDVGERLFFYLYAFFFGLATFVGNDPVILSGTAFLAYFTRVSVNIKLPTAWIYSQFAIANIASAILVSSNPTNLVLSGAFGIKFIHYTANMIVPVVVTAIVLFPFLLFIIFQDRNLVPYGKIELHHLLHENKDRDKTKAINPNIPHLDEADDEGGKSEEARKIRLLEEIFNPFVDMRGAAFGAILMAVTLITLLAVNASTPSNSKAVPVFYITLPAAFIMLCWDISFGWLNREETRRISRAARRKGEEARAARDEKLAAEEGRAQQFSLAVIEPEADPGPTTSPDPPQSPILVADRKDSPSSSCAVSAVEQEAAEVPGEALPEKSEAAAPLTKQRTTLVSLVRKSYTWWQETFPSCAAVVAHLPYALVPFAFSMFILVQALQSRGWVPVFAYGWSSWTNKTGTIGAIGGMGFLSVVLCNFAGTNIGTTILLSRVIQTWQQIIREGHTQVSDRTMWGAIYGMALGVNYGAFSIAFSASLAGLLWRDILGKKHIHVRQIDFARTNLAIIAIAMTIGCVVLIGEVYIMRSASPYDA